MAEMKRLPLTGIGRAVALSAVGLLVIAGVLVLRPGADERTITASFPRAVSIYEGSDVKVIGVTVGRVEKVEPAGTTVKVTLAYDAKVKVPADAKAVVVAPSVVGDRYVQLTPVYTSGPVLPDGARLAEDRTAVPLELDEIYQGIDDLTVGLGPDGANKDGALTRLLDSTAKNFGGQGEQFNTTISNLSKLTGTLDHNKDQLFGSAREIEAFVNTLAENDQSVRDFNDSLSGAADLLADERTDLAAALRNLGTAMQEVSSFVKENRQALSGNIKGLAKVTDILVKQRDALDETLKTAPVALTNLFHTYNASTGTLDTRANLMENVNDLKTAPGETLCSLVSPSDPTGALCNVIKGALPRSAPGKAGAARAVRSHGVVEIEHIDRTLGGILEVQR